MFQIGDKIFYPAQGGCVIQSVEEKEFLGKTQLYYTANIPHRNMQVMIPADKTESLGIRFIVNSEELDNVLATFYDGESDTILKDSQRYRLNARKIKTGNIYEGAEVIRDLVRINNTKKLGMTEKNMLDNAMQILISEIELVKGIPQQQATELLNKTINES